ncbi:hypothetical protein B0H19DRAFT_1058682 [Mycena capillaripes]|nr:hypothetical protein B0H19DRAFT_1058682 [Mycena capillaripes]
MGVYDDPFGSILIGSWLASILAGLVFSQAYRYFAMYPKDPISRKAIVVCSMLFCGAALIADYANVYLPTVTFWDEPPTNTYTGQETQNAFRNRTQSHQYWPVPMYVTMNTCVGVIVNSFLVHRFYTLSKNIVICMLLSAFIILGFAGSIFVAITIQMFSAFSARDKAEISALIWLISTAMADISIAAALIWKLRTLKTGFKGTQSLINRLVIQTIQTGSTTSVVSIVTLVSYIIKNDSNVPTACCFLIGPLYLLTLFYNLNIRQHDLSLSGSGRSTSDGNGINGGMRMDGILRNLIAKRNADIHRVTVEAVDPTRSVPPAGYNNSSIKDPETESYGGKKVPEF